MMPRPVLLATIALCAVVGALGLRIGWLYATFTETDAIDAAAADYVAHEAALGREVSPTDCSARPGVGVWLAVVCLPLSNPDATRTEYFVSRTGQMDVFRGG